MHEACNTEDHFLFAVILCQSRFKTLPFPSIAGTDGRKKKYLLKMHRLYDEPASPGSKSEYKR